MFQQTHLVSSLSLFENVAVAGYLDSAKNTKDVRRKVEELLKQMHVEKAKDRFPFEVSGGEAQRAAIRGTRILYLEDGRILDEMVFPVFLEEDAKNREKKLSDWLGALSW